MSARHTHFALTPLPMMFQARTMTVGNPSGTTRKNYNS
jgi:hypothetical protein